MMAVRRAPLAAITALLLLLPLEATTQQSAATNQPRATTTQQPATTTQPPAETPAESPTDGQAPPTVEALSRLTLPLAGNGMAEAPATFSGTLTLQGFAEQSAQVVAVGTISGIVATSSGVAGSVLRGPVALPVSMTPTKGGTPGQAPQTPQACGPLHLEIGAANLTVLGQTVMTSPVVLDISGEADTTGLLGALVCQVATTAGNVPGLVGVLNQILAVLGA